MNVLCCVFFIQWNKLPQSFRCYISWPILNENHSETWTVSKRNETQKHGMPVGMFKWLYFGQNFALKKLAWVVPTVSFVNVSLWMCNWFAYIAPEAWIALSSETRQTKPLDTFKSKLKFYLFTVHFTEWQSYHFPKHLSAAAACVCSCMCVCCISVFEVSPFFKATKQQWW